MHQHHHPVAAESGSIATFFARLFDADFVPRGDCVSWRPEIVWLHVLSDSAIMLAYYSIPVGLVYFVRRRHDLAFRSMFVMFAAFILACGTTHLMGVIAFWHPLYRLDGVIKFITAGLSIATAAALWKLIPGALALPSPSALRAANAELACEVAERKSAQAALASARDELEERVRQRTADLEALNRELQGEVAVRRTAEERGRLLLAELDHRVKNNLATVLALAEESIHNADSLDQFRAAFTGRLRALAHTHGALAASKWTGVHLGEVVRLGVEAHMVGRSERVSIVGPTQLLSPKAAAAMCMILNELATNAVKYGALSVPAGRVEIRWEVMDSPARSLRLRWSESGGPAVAKPSRRGFGTQLIEGAAAYELGGTSEIAYRPEGVVCTIEFPLHDANTRQGRFEEAAR